MADEIQPGTNSGHTEMWEFLSLGHPCGTLTLKERSQQVIINSIKSFQRISPDDYDLLYYEARKKATSRPLTERYKKILQLYYVTWNIQGQLFATDYWEQDKRDTFNIITTS